MSISLDSSLGRDLREAGVIAVLVVEQAERAVSLARSLVEGGVRVMELGRFGHGGVQWREYAL